MYLHILDISMWLVYLYFMSVLIYKLIKMQYKSNIYTIITIILY